MYRQITEAQLFLCTGELTYICIRKLEHFSPLIDLIDMSRPNGNE